MPVIAPVDPWQALKSIEGVDVSAGKAFTTKLLVTFDEQPVAVFVPTTVYVVLIDGLTIAFPP